MSSSSSSKGHSASSQSSSSDSTTEARDLPLAADHYILPHQANWLAVPSLSRHWRSSVDASLDLDEDRGSYRPTAWKTLRYEVLPYDHVERARLEKRLNKAYKHGKVGVPYWGKGITISVSSAVGATQITLDRSPNSLIAAGKYVFLQSTVPAEYETWDVNLVDSVSGTTVNLVVPLDYSYDASKARVWPIFFGRLLPETFEPINATRGRYAIAVKYDARTISAFGDENFGSYPVGTVTSPLDGGAGWASPWVRYQL